MKRVLFIIIAGFCLLFAGSAKAQTLADPAACAKACGAQYNMCLSRAPDFKGKCGTLPECQGVSDTDFDQYQRWFEACMDNPSLQCPRTCVPTQTVPTTPPVATPPTTTAPPRITTPPRPPMNLKYRCEVIEHGIYIKTVTVGENGAPETREECFKLQDALDRIKRLEERVTELEKNKASGANADVSTIISELTQIRDRANTMTERMQAVRERADQVIAQYNALVERVNDLGRRQQAQELEITGVKSQVAQLKDLRLSLPCWLAGYGEVQLSKNYGYVMGSEGLELGCRLFGSRELGFVTGLGGGYANRYHDHHLMELHAEFGLNAALGDNTDLLVMGAGKVFRSTTWERGTVSWYGLLPEVRYTFDHKDPWFLGGRIGIGVTNSVPPLPLDQTTGEQGSHFDANFWLMLGRSF